MNASDIMTGEVITIDPGATAGDAAGLMQEKSISCLPVVNARGTLVGILTHTDFGITQRSLPLGAKFLTALDTFADLDSIEGLYQELRSRAVREVMTQNVTTATEDTSLSEIVSLMLEKHVHRIPIMRDEELVGIVTRHDLLKLMTES